MDSTEAEDETRLIEWLLSMQDAPHIKRFGVGTPEVETSSHKFKIIPIDIARVQDQPKQR